MSVTRLNGFEHAIHTANIWLNTVAEEVGTDDRHLVNRMLRAWLHTLRDRLTVDVAANFGAQLPELLRGVYYEGWNPSVTPIKYDRAAYLRRFAHEAIVSESEAPRLIAAVTAGVRDHVSPGQLHPALDQLPPDVRDLVRPAD